MTLNLLRRWVFAVCLSVVVAGGLLVAQQTQTKPYKPEVGQPGKDVVWVPTAQTMVDKMLDMANVTSQDIVYDLGSGDGRTVITAAKRGARAFGIEYNPDMVELSRQNAAAAGVTDRATFAKEDLFQTDLSTATVVTMFLLPEINLKLRPKILALKPGTRVVSNSFTMEDWQPDETQTVEQDCENWCRALLWIVPANVEGTWRMTPQGEMHLTQQFQFVTGEVAGQGGSLPLADGKLRGDTFTFTLGGAQFTAKVNGTTMTGTAKGPSGVTNWTAARVQ